MTEDQLELEALGWLADVGYTILHGLDITPDGGSPECADYRQVVLVERLRVAVNKLNPAIPAAAHEDAVKPRCTGRFRCR
jgi:type I restriction enzyme R subunit